MVEYKSNRYAGMAELADASDLGSDALRRGGSSPLSRTKRKTETYSFGFFSLPKFPGLT